MDSDDDFRSYRRSRVDAKCRPSVSTPIVIEKSGWKGWAQGELFYYALGKGYDVSVDRASGGSIDVAMVEENENDDEISTVLCTVKEEDLESVARNLERWTERSCTDWKRAVDDIARSVAKAAKKQPT